MPLNLKPPVTDAYVYHDEGTDREVLVMGRTHHHMKTADEKAEASRRAPILDINSPLTSPGKYRAVKCRCNKSWCPSCSKNTIIKKLADRIKDWQWNHVRQIVLTIDRRYKSDDVSFDTPEAAFDYITSYKKIPNLFRNLERTLGIVAVDWVRVIEWHKDGYPHWHILVLAEKPNRAGQIGGDNLRRYWNFGIVRESYIHTKQHWNAFVGYFQKHGYFEHKKGKQHQVELPEWAKERKSVIRRIGSKSLKSMTEEEKLRAKIKRDVKKSAESAVAYEHYHDPGLGYNYDLGLELREIQDRKDYLKSLTQGEKLAVCGSSVEIYKGADFSHLSFVCTLNVSYKDFLKKVPGQFASGLGYVFDKNYISQFEAG